jgi:2-polyprenyl-3-methyl-5-hydroxy-6-metoxy-1,4-benzoquinol methylase
MDPNWRRAAGAWPIDLDRDQDLDASFDLLRSKWKEVPCGQYERGDSTHLVKMSDAEILEKWESGYLSSSTGLAFSVRGWYQTLYRAIFRGKKILDVGCGLGPDTVHYAEQGAIVTFLDIVESNVHFVERICKIKGISNASFCHMRSLKDLESLPANFDAIYCCGSLINTPLELARMEAQALLRHLPPGGRWIELAYPKTRWVREGRMDEREWGSKTDGGAPWMEWHDLAKLDFILSPATFDTVLYLEFHNSDFNWFDLIRRI